MKIKLIECSNRKNKIFNSKQIGALYLAINSLSLEGYIDSYAITEKSFMAFFDCYSVKITSPIEDAMHFELFETEKEGPLENLLTESVHDALPIRRVILSLLGIPMLSAFKREWDGHAIKMFVTQH